MPNPFGFDIGTPAGMTSRKPRQVAPAPVPFGFVPPKSKMAQTMDILAPYVTGPVDAFWRLMESPAASGFDFTEQNAADALTAGGGPIAAGSVVPKPTNALNMGIRAYHGSPHSFDKFDMSKIGTGEGAQAYGHGLYFAENEDVAKGYREALSDGFKIDGVPYNATTTKAGATTPGHYAADALSRFKGDKQAAIDWLNEGGSPTELEAAKLLKKAKSVEPWQGSMYEVNINADPNDFLDWDKPLSEQPEAVRKALPKLLENAPSPKKAPSIRNRQALQANDGSVPGDIIWNNLGGHNYPEETRKKFLDAGIPGIKYLDAGSRAPARLAPQLDSLKAQLADAESKLPTAGRHTAMVLKNQIDNLKRQIATAEHPGTRNYVVFDDKLIEIVRKYGIAGASAMLGYNILNGMDDAQAAELKRIEANK